MIINIGNSSSLEAKTNYKSLEKLTNNSTLELYLLEDDLYLSQSNSSKLRLRIWLNEIFNSQQRSSSFKIDTFEVKNGQRYYLASNNETIKKNQKRTNVIINIENLDNVTERNLEFEVYDTNSELVDKFKATINIIKDDSLASNNTNNSSNNAACNNENFNDCQLDYFFKNVVFEAKPSNNSFTQIQKNSNGKYKLTFPIPKKAFDVKRNPRKKSKVDVTVEEFSGSLDTAEDGSIVPTGSIDLAIGNNEERWNEAYFKDSGLHIGSGLNNEASLSYNPSSQNLEISTPNGVLSFDGTSLLVNSQAIGSSNSIPPGVIFENTVQSLSNKTLAAPTVISPTITTSLKFSDGSEAAGRVLTSDALGNATWQAIPGGGLGDILDGGNTEAAAVTIGTNDANALNLETNNVTHFTLDATGNLIYNEAGSALDTRFEGDTDANLLITDGSTDRVGIGVAAPTTKLDVNGTVNATAFTGNGSGLTNLDTADISSGTLATARGGTGVSNGAGSMTFAGAVNMGANDLSFTTSGATTLTLPTTGTVATLAGTETLTNKTITSPLINTGLQYTDGNQGAGKVLTSDATGNATWQAAASGGAFATALNVTSNSPGDQTNDDFVFGSPQLADDGDPNHDNRMWFDKSKAAFRVGQADSTQWNTVGDYSIAIGRKNSATSFASIAIGHASDSTASDSVAIGNFADATALRALALGRAITASGSQSHVIGVGIDDSNRINNNIDNSLMIGYNSTIPTFFVGPSAGAGTTGNIGIATSTPDASAKLDINGQIKIQGGTPGAGKVLTSDANGLATWQAAAGGSGDITNGGNTEGAPVIIGSNDIQPLSLETNNTTRLHIASVGNIGIGTVTPDELLHLEGSTDGTQVVLLLSNAQAADAGTNESVHQRFGLGTNNDVGRIVVGKVSDYQSVANEDSFMAFYTDRNGTATEALRINNDGDVGIGTSSPSIKLEISEAEDTEFIRLQDSTNVDSVGLFTGSGTPESNVTAQLGSAYFDHANGALYIKDSGDGTNTGWVALGAGGGGSNGIYDPTGTDPGDTFATQYKELAANGSNYVGFKAPDSIASDISWVLPAADGTPGQYLQTDGSGNLTFAAGGGGGDFLADGTVAMTDPLVLEVLGSAGAPSLTFTSDTTMGIYRPLVGNMAFSTAGAERMRINSTEVNIKNELDVDGGANITGDAVFNNQILMQTGSLASPSYSFNGDTSTGIYRSAPNTVNIVTAGANRMTVNSTKVNVINELDVDGGANLAGTITLTGQQQNASGSLVAPSYSFTGDTGTGIYRSGPSTVSIATGGATGMTVNTTKVNVINELDVDGGANITGDATFNDQILINSGAVGDPSYSFTGDTNTGMYRSGPGTIAWATTGTQRMVLNGTELNVKHELDVDGGANIAGTITFTGQQQGATGSAAAPAYSFSGDPDIGMYRSGLNTLDFATNGIQRLTMSSSSAVFNEAGNDYDFRVEGDTSPNALVVDASADAVGIGTGTPARALHISDVMRLQPRVSAPGSPAAGDIYVDTSGAFCIYLSGAWEVAAGGGSCV